MIIYSKTSYSQVFFFSIWIFSYDHSRITGLQGKGEGISLTPHYHFHPLHRHLDISRAITAESSPLHIARSRTRTGNLWFPSASRKPLSYCRSSRPEVFCKKTEACNVIKNETVNFAKFL